MPKPTPAPKDMRALAGWLTKVAAFADQYDWTGMDLESPPKDMRLMARDLSEVADEIGRDLKAHNLATAELRAEKRAAERAEEARELAHMIGGAL